jgi:hypothetical protein
MVIFVSSKVTFLMLNYYVLLIFAPLLIVIGILGFIIPANKSLTSGAPAYNLFHIVFGLIGLGIVYSQPDPCIRAFNIGFGVIDLYQAAASFLHLFPEKHFRWKRADDILHVAIGAGLVLTGLLGN